MEPQPREAGLRGPRHELLPHRAWVARGCESTRLRGEHLVQTRSSNFTAGQKSSCWCKNQMRRSQSTRSLNFDRSASSEPLPRPSDDACQHASAGRALAAGRLRALPPSSGGECGRLWPMPCRRRRTARAHPSPSARTNRMRSNETCSLLSSEDINRCRIKWR